MKMKLSGFLLSYFVFINVSAFNEADYKKEVYTTNIAIERACNNGLEFVIESMVNDNDYYKSFAKINFMIALPDQTEIVNEIPEKLDLDELRKSMHYQFMMRLEIKDTLKTSYPEVDRDIYFGSLNLTSLAQVRRRYVTPFLKNIIRRVIDESQDHIWSDGSLLRMCRLMGLYTSAMFPTKYIKNLHVDYNNSTCILSDGIQFRSYRKMNDVWWQVDLVDINRGLQLLEDQLK